MAARVDRGAARIIEWQAEAEGLSFPDLRDPLFDLVGGQEVEPAELIVRAPIAPGRAGRTIFPARIVRHFVWPLPVRHPEERPSGRVSKDALSVVLARTPRRARAGKRAKSPRINASFLSRR